VAPNDAGTEGSSWIPIRQCGEDYSGQPHQHEGDVRVAKRVVAVHVAEGWPAGTYCRNDRAVFPCRWYRWGGGVLAAAGWTDDAIAALAQSGPAEHSDGLSGRDRA
jgi:hypothetical protein